MKGLQIGGLNKPIGPARFKALAASTASASEFKGLRCQLFTQLCWTSSQSDGMCRSSTVETDSLGRHLAGQPGYLRRMEEDMTLTIELPSQDRQYYRLAMPFADAYRDASAR